MTKSGTVRGTSSPGGQNCCSAAILSKRGGEKNLISHIFDYHNTITLVVTHVLILCRSHKTVDFLTLRCLCVLFPGRAERGQASCRSLSPLLSSLASSALSAIRLPLLHLLLQPITQASLCCTKSCSCSNTPGKSSLKHVGMRGPVW